MTSTPTRRELLAWFVVFAMLVALTIALQPNVADGSYGDATSEQGVTEAAAPQPEPEVPPVGTALTVYVATGLNFPDALGAAGAAGVALGPVLLVTQSSIPPETLAELNRLQPTRIVVVGGSAVISDTVKLALEGLAFSPTVDRIAGTNRYDTAAKLSADTHWTRGFHPRMTWATSETAIPGDNSDQVVLTVDHNALIPGVYMMFAGADLYGSIGGNGDGYIECELWVTPPGGSAAYVTATRRSPAIGGPFTSGPNGEEDCATQGYYIAITPGTYTLEFRVNADTDITINERSLVAYWNAYYPGS